MRLGFLGGARCFESAGRCASSVGEVVRTKLPVCVAYWRFLLLFIRAIVVLLSFLSSMWEDS
jgi:hypothetical protein